MAKHTIFIMGDSTSMTIGCERHMYPFLIADSACWPESTEIINCSQPGFTSADGCAFFFRHKKEYTSLRSVLIHLGTCDSVSWEIHRKKYSIFRQAKDQIMELREKAKERTRLKNRLLHFEWNKNFDSSLEYPEPPDAFEYNLSRIIKACIKLSIPVVIIKPKANSMFPSGVGKGNFIFYRYLGINEKLSHKLSIPDKRFLDALHLQESGDYSGAIDKYRDILFTSGDLSFHNEYQLLIVNNYAVCMAEKGGLKEADILFNFLLKERGVRREIVLFNLAKVYQMQGDMEKYRKTLYESSEEDRSMYRIRSPYLESIDRIHKRFGDKIHLVDIGAFIDDSLFVDHTHPLRKGQKIIAERVADCLKLIGITGDSTACVKNVLYNPELSLGNTTEFFKYYRTYDPYKNEKVCELLNQIKKDLLDNNSYESEMKLMQGLPKELRTAIEYHLIHPCFPSLRYLVHDGPQYAIDVGRFPEFFLCRYLFKYIRLYESYPELSDLFSSGVGILRNSSEILAMLPTGAISLVSYEVPLINVDIEIVRLPAILMKCRKVLIAHLRQGNQIHERIKTTIFWYFREALRYGTHSRISMRYERTILEYLAEALAVASVLNFLLGEHHLKEIKEIIEYLEETVCIHEQYCQRFDMIDESKGLLIDYDRRLFELADKLEIR